MIENILKNTDQKLIGLGIGHGTKHVEEYYPNSLADVNIEEMAEKMYYQPVERGLEIKISAKMEHLEALNRQASYQRRS